MKKSTGLIGNYVDAVSGTDWNTNHDSSVNVYECAGTSYASSSCTGALTIAPIEVETTPASKVGDFPSTGVGSKWERLEAAPAALSTSPACSLVVEGSSGDSSDVTLSFAVPSVKVSKATGVLGNYVEKVTSSSPPSPSPPPVKDFPIGDTIDAVECDSSVNGQPGTDCNNTTLISGSASAAGGVRDGVVIGRAHHAGRRGLQRQRNGSCLTGGSCSWLLSTRQFRGQRPDGVVGMAIPSLKVSKKTGVLGNYAEKVTVKYGPIGDTIDAVECDSSVSTANLGQNCDNGTQISGTASTRAE